MGERQPARAPEGLFVCVPDPAGKTLDEIRPIRDEIDRRVGELLNHLQSATTLPSLQSGNPSR